MNPAYLPLSPLDVRHFGEAATLHNARPAKYGFRNMLHLERGSKWSWRFMAMYAFKVAIWPLLTLGMQNPDLAKTWRPTKAISLKPKIQNAPLEQRRWYHCFTLRCRMDKQVWQLSSVDCRAVLEVSGMNLQGRKRNPNLNFLVRIFPGGVGVFHVKRWGPKSSVCPSRPGKSNFFGGISRDFAGISRGCPKSLRKKGLCSIFVP